MIDALLLLAVVSDCPVMVISTSTTTSSSNEDETSCKDGDKDCSKQPDRSSRNSQSKGNNNSAGAGDGGGGGSVWKIPANIQQTALDAAAQARGGLGTHITTNAIADPDLLKALTNHRAWFSCYENTRGSHTHWMDWGAQPRNLMERVAVHLWSQEPMVQGQTFAGYEIWCNLLTPEGPLDWHVDKDQIEYSRSGKLKFPYYGSVYYGYPHEFEGGFLETTRFDPHNDEDTPYEADDIERIGASYNRFVVFNATQYHRVSPVTSGTRVTLAINLWKERPLVADLK